MYRRFLNDNDYYSIITKEALNQLTRGEDSRLCQAEESAEMSIVEYLSENYEVENELNKGKYIANYERSISYPVGVHVYYDDAIYKVIRSISGYKTPCSIEYWEEYSDISTTQEVYKNYSQFETYYIGNIIAFNGVPYKCLSENGYMFHNIKIPGVTGWKRVDFTEWQPVSYELWDVVFYNNCFYTLISTDGFDNNTDPENSDSWGAIADYTAEYNNYELSNNEYVVYEGEVFCPEIDVNSDMPQIGVNLSLHDPRNYNLKKHLLRLCLYELTKLIAPNNVSVIRVKDYEDSMKWLTDASRLKINPQIPRKLAEDKKPVTDWQLATFQTDYDPYKNPWLT